MFVFADPVRQFLSVRTAIAGATLLVVCSVPVNGCRRQTELTSRESKGINDAPPHGADTLERVETSDRNSLPQQFLATAVDDPTADGWAAEALNLKVSVQLKLIHQLIGSPDRSTTHVVEQLATDDFRCNSLRPPRLKKVFTDGSLEVSRAANDSLVMAADFGDRPAGPAALSDALMKLRRPFSGKVRVETKVIGITRAKEYFSTEVLYQAFGRAQRGIIQQNARWTCQWTRGRNGKPPQLKRLAVEDHQEVLYIERRQLARGKQNSENESQLAAGRISQNVSATMFIDDTAAVMAADTAFQQQLRPGIDYWMRRVPTALGITAWGDHGLAIGDVNGDGRDDIYLCQPGGLPNLLYLGQADTTLKNISGYSRADWLDDTRSALLVDLDNDADQDLVIGSREFLMLMENDGTGRFRLRADFREARDAFSLSAADYDNDGDLDIYVCRYYSDGSQQGGHRARFSAPLPYHDATNGPRNVLLRNDGGWRFRDATDATGMQKGNHRWSYAAAWEDYDNDGDQDIYVANDFGPNNLYRNDRGRFTETAAAAGVLDASTGMSVDWADYNRDGWMDLYVGNMFSAAGQRVMSQLQFKPDENDDMRDRYRHLARGNTLLQNRRDGAFNDVTLSAAVNMGRWSWSSNFVDLNNDGWEDLVVANGYYSGEKKDDL